MNTEPLDDHSGDGEHAYVYATLDNTQALPDGWLMGEDGSQETAVEAEKRAHQLLALVARARELGWVPSPAPSERKEQA